MQADFIRNYSIASNNYCYGCGNNGNITKVYHKPPITNTYILLYKYAYDAQNQLIRSDSISNGKANVYAYSATGNILSNTAYDCDYDDNGDVEDQSLIRTINYGYGNTGWKDLLTSYNGNTITYDAIGNPLTYNGNTYTWTQGRRLAGITNSSKNISYEYNSDGIRTSKTVNGVTTDYVLEGSNIIYQNDGTNQLWFTYDAAGKLTGFTLKQGNASPQNYYYVRNVQGDITAIYDETGTIISFYQYDAWGKFLGIFGNQTIGGINPFRYRGYYWDAETGYYYLNSRYYNAEWGRFINADKAISATGKSLQGYNLFVYCFNNPINATDPAGNWPQWLETVAKAVAVAAVTVTAVVVVTVVVAGTGGLALAAAGVAFGTACGGLVGGIANEKKGGSFIKGWAGGAVNGFTQSVGTAAFGPAGTIVGGGIGSGLGTAVTEKLNNIGKPKEQQKSSNAILKESLKSAAVGTVMSAMTAGIGYGIDYAQGSFGYNSWSGSLNPNVGIASITPGFGELMKGFFGSVDDALVYLFCE